MTVATLFLRYHYFVDAFAGGMIGFASFYLVKILLELDKLSHAFLVKDEN